MYKTRPYSLMGHKCASHTQVHTAISNVTRMFFSFPQGGVQINVVPAEYKVGEYTHAQILFLLCRMAPASH